MIQELQYAEMHDIIAPKSSTHPFFKENNMDAFLICLSKLAESTKKINPKIALHKNILQILRTICTAIKTFKQLDKLKELIVNINELTIAYQKLITNNDQSKQEFLANNAIKQRDLFNKMLANMGLCSNSNKESTIPFENALIRFQKSTQHLTGCSSTPIVSQDEKLLSPS